LYVIVCLAVFVHCSIVFQLKLYNCKLLVETIVSIISLLIGYMFANLLIVYTVHLFWWYIVFSVYFYFTLHISLYVMQVPRVEVLEHVSSILKEYGFNPTGEIMDTIDLY